jgi:hypothetical protein
MDYAAYNKRIINTISRDDRLLPCYLKALDDITLRYKSVRVRLWDMVERHTRYTIDIEYRRHKAQEKYVIQTQDRSSVGHGALACLGIYCHRAGHLFRCCPIGTGCFKSIGRSKRLLPVCILEGSETLALLGIQLC